MVFQGVVFLAADQQVCNRSVLLGNHRIEWHVVRAQIDNATVSVSLLKVAILSNCLHRQTIYLFLRLLSSDIIHEITAQVADRVLKKVKINCLTKTAAPSNKKGSLKTEVSAVREPLGVVAKTASALASSFCFAKIATSMKSSMWVALRSPAPERSQSSSKKEVPTSC